MNKKLISIVVICFCLVQLKAVSAAELVHYNPIDVINDEAPFYGDMEGDHTDLYIADYEYVEIVGITRPWPFYAYHIKIEFYCYGDEATSVIVKFANVVGQVDLYIEYVDESQQVEYNLGNGQHQIETYDKEVDYVWLYDCAVGASNCPEVDVDICWVTYE